MGVKAITVYAFSIDNFRRGTEEVDALMALAEQKLLELMEVRVAVHDSQTELQALFHTELSCAAEPRHH